MTKAYSEIAVCRLSGSRNLTPVLNLGQQALTGIFPRTPEEIVTEGPLELVWCADSGSCNCGIRICQRRCMAITMDIAPD